MRKRKAEFGKKNPRLDKMTKNVKMCREKRKKGFQLIHIEKVKKREKQEISKKLSTLSTQKPGFSVDYFEGKKNGRFVEL